MKYKIDHDYHIHSYLSTCSKDDLQTPENILNYAKKNGLHSICLTDHYWDSEVGGASKWYMPQNYEHISLSLPLPKCKDVDFLFGCEGDMDKNCTIGIPQSRYDSFDFMIIPTTHLHMLGFTIDEQYKTDINEKSKLWVTRLDAVLNSNLPFKKIGIAHPACFLMMKYSRKDYIKLLDSIPDCEIERVFAKAASLGCGIELNYSDMSFSDNETDSVLRMFRWAKNCGCKFYLGSDAHTYTELNMTTDAFERAINILGLTENDKFHINR